MAIFKPTYYAKTIYEVSIDFYKKIGVTTLLLDLDNTLDPYNQKWPSQNAINLIHNLKEHGFRPIIVSNNFKGRVNEYAKKLDIECFYRVKKPRSGRLLKILKEKGINKDRCIMIGDQLVTDIRCGNACKIKTLLTETLSKKEFIGTYIHRIIDKPLHYYYKKCGKLNYWKKFL